MTERQDFGKKKRETKCTYFYHKCTYCIVTRTENFFYNLGVIIGTHPKRTIIICWIVVILSALGFLRFRQEKNPLKLWIPPGTTFTSDSEWLMKSLQIGYQEEAVMLTGEDVLTPNYIQKLYKLDQELRETNSAKNLVLQDVCFLIPKVDRTLLKFLDTNNTKSDPSKDLNPMLYCSFIESMKKECYMKSILDLWNFKKVDIMNLTKQDIVNAINSESSDQLLGNLKNFRDLLGMVERNETGHIIRAQALYNYWYLTKNFSAIDVDKTGNMAGTGDWATEEAVDWEGMFLNVMENFSNSNEIFYYAGRSFGDISNDSLFQDMDLIIYGVIVMVVYIQLVISKFNLVEMRIVLGSIGLLSVGMSFIVGSGLCSLVGVAYGPVHTSLPFLLMGLGVDDIFVIMACWEELSMEEKKLSIPERIGLTLKHAGVSITITSTTDVIAFIISSSTILPSLESFCIYAAVGVLMTFIFAITFFVACFVLDQRRVEANRNGAFPWIVHNNYKPNECSQINFTNLIFNKVYSNVILTIPGKITVITISIICAGFSIQSTMQLEQKFNPEWFIPEKTHLGKFFTARDMYYPHVGFDAGLYMGAVNYSQEIPKIKKAVDELKRMTNVTENIVSWVDPFRDFVLFNYQHDIYVEPLDDDRFDIFLSKFLMSPWNAQYQANFIFERDLECGLPAPKIKLSTINFFFRKSEQSSDQISAMHKVRTIAENMNFTTGDKFATVWSKFFATWITDELIGIEVTRNLELALLCVMLCTIPLIANWQICCLIFFCVLITMVNVCGFMQRWGVTIDLVSCIGLELAIGLCVDYATHVGHTFLTVSEGNRRERVIKSVTSIGSAVLYGGLSTFIGVSMMSLSSTYTFQSFFKIFFLVIIFGLFHGVVLLPVILSFIGPAPYPSHKKIPHQVVELDPLNDNRINENSVY
ncbi:protein patched homolog 1-like isoform X1 [Diorhabda carinulata]|uniref:protein patched homolog 1-like isoform X1 n=2 Tax=Diorhabda carinulata TaxID=1163345 RepID=UPI0025A21154|nr:protein patched homolog 1-like isoform X1 [Diorhabda carinulata]